MSKPATANRRIRILLACEVFAGAWVFVLSPAFFR